MQRRRRYRPRAVPPPGRPRPAGRDPARRGRARDQPGEVSVQHGAKRVAMLHLPGGVPCRSTRSAVPHETSHTIPRNTAGKPNLDRMLSRRFGRFRGLHRRLRQPERSYAVRAPTRHGLSRDLAKARPVGLTPDLRRCENHTPQAGTLHREQSRASNAGLKHTGASLVTTKRALQAHAELYETRCRRVERRYGGCFRTACCVRGSLPSTRRVPQSPASGGGARVARVTRARRIARAKRCDCDAR